VKLRKEIVDVNLAGWVALFCQRA